MRRRSGLMLTLYLFIFEFCNAAATMHAFCAYKIQLQWIHLWRHTEKNGSISRHEHANIHWKNGTALWTAVRQSQAQPHDWQWKRSELMISIRVILASILTVCHILIKLIKMRQPNSADRQHSGRMNTFDSRWQQNSWNALSPMIMMTGSEMASRNGRGWQSIRIQCYFII